MVANSEYIQSQLSNMKLIVYPSAFNLREKLVIDNQNQQSVRIKSNSISQPARQSFHFFPQGNECINNRNVNGNK